VAKCAACSIFLLNVADRIGGRSLAAFSLSSSFGANLFERLLGVAVFDGFRSLLLLAPAVGEMTFGEIISNKLLLDKQTGVNYAYIMAKGLSGPLVFQIRGKVGNEVFAVQDGIQTIKAYNATPYKDPPSDKMLLMQAIMTAAAAAWKELTESEQTGWIAYANTQRYNVSSRTQGTGADRVMPVANKNIDGRQLFVACWCNAFLHGQFDPITWDKFNYPWDNLTGWSQGGTGTKEINPAGYLHLSQTFVGSTYVYRDIGTLPDTGFTVEFALTADQISVLATGNTIEHDFYTPSRRFVLLIASDKIEMLNAAGAFDTADVVTSTTIEYTWRLVCDGNNQKCSVYRRTSTSVWELLNEFTSIKADATADGRVLIGVSNAGVDSTELHEDYIRGATGLWYGEIAVQNPLSQDKPPVPDNFEASFSAPNIELSWDEPDGWDDVRHRVGFWLSGNKSALGRIYKQWANYQPDPTDDTYNIDAVYVVGATEEVLTDLYPAEIRIQAYVCDIQTGLVSAPTQTIKVEIV